MFLHRGWVSGVVRTAFPAVVTRFKADAQWHFKQYGIEPLFDCFWNMCWNVAFPGQARIHTPPHIDWKNFIGVCSIFTYLGRAGRTHTHFGSPTWLIRVIVKFNHKYRTWLVIWELNVIMEMIPWALTSYPSSLFLHFNIDMHRASSSI